MKHLGIDLAQLTRTEIDEFESRPAVEIRQTEAEEIHRFENHRQKSVKNDQNQIDGNADGNDKNKTGENDQNEFDENDKNKIDENDQNEFDENDKNKADKNDRLEQNLEIRSR
jgi:hypothetical protein